jgi:hypothetical protein
MKLSRRQRYILKWNGPDSLRHRKQVYAACKRQMGRGDETQRMVATAYVCRFRGFYPRTDVELCQRAGVPHGQLGRTARRMQR